MILAGGMATRLGKLAESVPKPLLTVAGRPFITYLLDQLSDAGVSQAILCTGHLSEVIEETLGARYGDVELVYSKEPFPLGTAGALRNALSLIDEPALIAMNGDSYVSADLGSFAEWADERNSILAVHVDETNRYGSITFDDSKRIVRFDEKSASAGPGWINGGVYILTRELIAGVEAGKTVSIERDTFPAAIGSGIYVWQSDGGFLDIGTPDSLEAAETFFEKLKSTT